MRLEDQVTSLELSQKLKELGVKQLSFFYHVFPQSKFSLISDWLRIVDAGEGPQDVMTKHSNVAIASTFTVAELGEMLPFDQSTGQPMIIASGRKNDSGYFCQFLNGGGARTVPFVSSTEADARAKMLIYLIENKLITL